MTKTKDEKKKEVYTFKKGEKYFQDTINDTSIDNYFSKFPFDDDLSDWNIAKKNIKITIEIG